MMNLARNLFPVHFKLYLGKEEIIDEYGNRTGTYKTSYGDLQTASLSVSPSKGTAEAEMFGMFDDYDRTMTTADTTCEIDENTILWLDGADTTKAHNYIVKRRAPWKNSIAFAVKKVEMTNAAQNTGQTQRIVD